MTTFTRRGFVAALTAAASSLAGARAVDALSIDAPRALSFAHLHTGERLSLEYYRDGAYQPEALAAVNQLLRDFRSGEVGTIDPRLLDLLHRLSRLTATRRPFEIISGYRSPATNEALRRHSGGVASQSLHIKGQAIDIRLTDVPLAQLRDAALSMHAGGVGYYVQSNFVHVDTGRVRTW